MRLDLEGYLQNAGKNITIVFCKRVLLTIVFNYEALYLVPPYTFNFLTPSLHPLPLSLQR